MQVINLHRLVIVLRVQNAVAYSCRQACCQAQKLPNQSDLDLNLPLALLLLEAGHDKGLGYDVMLM